MHYATFVTIRYSIGGMAILQHVTKETPLTNPPLHSVSFRNLLCIYAVIPACLLIYLIDKYVFSFSLRAALPTFPHEIVLINCVFGLPHILASTAILFTTQAYYTHYKYRIWLGSAVIIVGLGLGSLTLSYAAMFFLIAAASAAHLVKQQIGIGNMLCRMSGVMYKVWAWSGIAVAIILFTAMFQKMEYNATQLEYLNLAAFSLLCLHICTTLYWQLRIRTADIKGQLFLWGNCAMTAATAWLYSVDYFFLAILAPRVIHDATAFYIYITHDKNRLAYTKSTWLYRLTQKGGTHIVWLSPILAVCIAYFMLYQLNHSLQWAASKLLGINATINISIAVLTFLNIFHYYTESFTWGRGSPYRTNIGFSH